MVISKDPVTPDTLKQQTLDSLVRKSKHGRSLTKKLDNAERPIVKEEEPTQINKNTKTEPVSHESDQKPPRVQPKVEVKRESKRPVTDKIKRAPVKSAPTSRSARTKKEKEVKVSPKSEERCQKLTDYFPVRRSKRQPLSKIKDLEYEQLKDKILSKSTDGLEIRVIEDKGRGVFSTRHFARKEFIVEYSGTLISYDEAKRREAEYIQEPEKYGCYMYYFVFKNKKYCVDGTAEDGSYGRLLNHSKNGNVESKLININNRPVLILVAKVDIEPETELSYDYGERSKEIIDSHPWLNQ
ncbi:N-lysine methyltransferase KMT5A-like isoform X2 [Bolinopsis microptera]|uniref:N-lysine methyltransferase KMT5A-like isoform X2 n=1 Tax=Bolinopsis microptera TaxID=2820187 RepID=UPI003079F151